jgi:hypothetical protein
MKWKADEIKFLQENYSTRVPLEDISEKLGRTIRSIQRKAQEMKISRPRKEFDREKLRRRQKKANNKFYAKNSKKIFERKRDSRKEKKLWLMSLLGGKCSKCGYNKCEAALEFHHIGKDKEGDISHIIKDGSRQKALKEIKKCVLLCANCHREAHHIKGFIV